MVQTEIVKYVRTCLKQGYNFNTISTMLQNAGYSQYDIRRAIKEAQKKPPVKIITTKNLIIAFSAIVILIIIIILVMKLVAEPANLELTLKPFKTEIIPGEQLIITADIQNIGEKQTKTLLNAVVIGPDGKESLPSKTITLKDKASVPIKATIKPAATPGTYTLTVTLSYDGRMKTKSLQFLVKERTGPLTEAPKFITKEEETKEELLECVVDCDDLDKCTQDKCVSGRCVNTPIVPCCGNNFCESGETAQNCIQDCESTIQKAPKECQEIVDKKEADECFMNLAATNRNKNLCQYILEDEFRDVCYIKFAYRKDFTVCDKITNQYTRNTCYTLENLVEVEAKN